MSALFERLAIARKNLQGMSKRDYTLRVIVLEKLYDVAIDNAMKPGELPNLFYLTNIDLSKPELDAFLAEIGVEANTTVVNKGGMYGDMYQVDLRK